MRSKISFTYASNASPKAPKSSFAFPWLILLQEDRGGNSVDVRFNGRKENLHSRWDTALVELEQGTAAEIAARMQAVVTDQDRQQWQQGSPADWALESLAVVRTRVYRLPASREITASYVESASAVILTRLAQAGVRLAWMLNETFPQ